MLVNRIICVLYLRVGQIRRRGIFEDVLLHMKDVNSYHRNIII